MGAARRGGSMVTIVSRPTGGECGAGGYSGGVDCIEAIVSGLWCRDYGVGGRRVEVRCVEAIVSGWVGGAAGR